MVARQSTPIESIAAARRRRPLTKKAFLREVKQEGIIDVLDSRGLWRDDNVVAGDGLGLNDLWMFYKHSAKSDWDDSRLKLMGSPKRLIRMAKMLRNAAKQIRSSLSVLAVFALLSGREAETLRQASEIIEVTPETRSELIAAGIPPDRILGFASQLEQLARRYGRPQRPAFQTDFLVSWASFAKRRTGRYLDDVGELLYVVCLGCDAPKDYSRSRRQAGRRKVAR